jgi:hypothetical protein
MRTTAESAVASEVTRLLGDDKEWRVVALLATYKRPSDGERECHIASAVALRSKECALDYAYLIGRLRTLANELEDVALGRRPMPQQEG